MKHRLFNQTLPLCAAILAVAAWWSFAGNLNPPAGEVTPTMKTLTEVEPRIAINATNTPGDATSLYKITQAGSYYLTGNITGVVGKHGIGIAASGVTVDLNGFDLVGVANMGAFDGVSVTVGGLVNIAVINGSVRSWGGDDIDSQTTAATNCRVADVRVRGGTGNGILIGPGSTVTNCSAYQKAGDGISTGTGCTVTNCTAYSNAGDGIRTGSDCNVSNCTSRSNTGNGITTVHGCTVTNCSVFQNSGNGIDTGSGCTVSNGSAYDNVGSGITTDQVGTVTNCSAASNSVFGILAGDGCTVADCTTRGNTQHGIACLVGCVIRGNVCTLNGFNGDGAGVHVSGGGNRIEGNKCTGADRGIEVNTAGNVITKNVCSGNTTNWSIVVGNAVAPIVQASTNASAISGNTYTGNLGSTDSNANFTY